MSEPLVSVIVPVRNRSELIKDTLKSVQKQTYKNWEAVVVDDASEDATVPVVKKFAASDSRIRLVSETNRETSGAPSCRNEGVKRAEGEYVVFLDSDDILADFCLSQRVRACKRNKDVDFLVFPGLIFTAQPYDWDVLIGRCETCYPLAAFLNFDSPWNTLNVLWKRESLRNSGLKWDEHLSAAQDAQFHMDAILLGLRYECVDTQPDCFWRKHRMASIGLDARDPNNVANYFYFVDRQIDALRRADLLEGINYDNVRSLLLGKAINSCKEGFYDAAIDTVNFVARHADIATAASRIVRLYVTTYCWLSRYRIKYVRGIVWRLLFPMISKLVGKPSFDNIMVRRWAFANTNDAVRDRAQYELSD